MTYNLDFLTSRCHSLMNDRYKTSYKRELSGLCEIYPNATIAQVEWSHGGVYSECYSPVSATDIFGWDPPQFPVQNKKFVEEIKISDKRVVYIGFLINTWGHVITDLFARLWFVKTQECVELVRKGYSFACLADYKSIDAPSYLYKILSYVGISNEQLYWVEADEPTRFAEVCVPNATIRNFHGDCYFTLEYRDFCQSFSALFPEVNKIAKIYFTRSNFKGGHQDIGEKRIDKLFEKHGYTILSPELFSFAEQVSLLSQCTHFASTEGSISHNAVFCKPNTKVIILKKADYFNGYQRVIDEAADLDVTYISAHHSTRTHKTCPCLGPFYLCVTPQLARYFHIRIYIPYWLLPSFWWYILENSDCLVNKYILNRKMMKPIQEWVLRH